MQAFTAHTGTAVAIDLANIDTDQIIPKQFLKRIDRTGFGEFLFNDWRFSTNGEPITSFPLNDPRFSGASILVTGENFGCGSSREHAPWSLMDFGFRVVIASSFADIFYENSLKNGLLPVVLSGEEIDHLMRRIEAEPKTRISVDLAEQTVSTDDLVASFTIHEFSKYRLLNGLDDIGITLRNGHAISKFESKMEANFDYLAFPSPR